MKISEPKIINNDTVIINNQNTTIGYANFNIETKMLDYLFVNPSFRRRGIGSKLLLAAEKVSGGTLQPANPISPLGERFFKARISKNSNYS
jgi:GNAT superfamily N-acetyltransferase